MIQSNQETRKNNNDISWSVWIAIIPPFPDFDLKEKEPHFEVVFDSEASKVVDRLVAELVLYHIVVVAASTGCVF